MAAHHPWHRPMAARDTAEENRTSTPLELFFDLCFVVAVAQVSTELHHFLADDHLTTALTGFLTCFFAIWWAWMGFTWFASAYDTDDVPYRLAALVTITGALILAAGVRRAYGDGDFAGIVVGYTVMRLAAISLWLRAAHGDAAGRSTALRFAGGLVVVQALWAVWLIVPADAQLPVFPLLAALDLSVPLLSERRSHTPWHAEHIAERYGLFTMIVLGESILSATTAVRRAIDAEEATGDLYVLAGGGLLTVFSMWWLYFAKPAARILTSTRTGFIWGYGHYLIFGAAAAVGAGLAVNVDHVTHHAHIPNTTAAATLTVPVAIYLVTLWALHLRPHHVAQGLGVGARFPVAALLVLAGTFTAMPVLVTGAVTAALAAAGIVTAHRATARERGGHSSATPPPE
ncbi:low temperature requirement protein A [Streptomyces sp. RFCAC02]|uniref:low temperature requirement protein A n=1 Tax=Streptomyces sp. RFCAC02 TaxID=2499143 RepID=UPI0010208A6E|nr:low temperature requirement protein A [Streptomyces sp. RFCAC02]